MADVALLVNGSRYAGWTSARITRGIESVAGGFELSVSDRWRAGVKPWSIYEEDECRIIINGTTLITGYVDKRSLSYGPGDHALSLSGRDKTGQLVDCSAVPKGKWEFLDVPVLTLVQRVAEPFGIKASLQPGITTPKPLAKLTIDPGDSAFDVIERACRKSGLLAISDGVGGLHLMRPGSTKAVTELVEGQNILSAAADFDASQRFRRYLVLGQHPGSDDFFGEQATTIRAEATDSGVRRGERVLLVRPEGTCTTAFAKLRAQWEATVRASRGDNITVTVQGWTQGDGSLWPVNALARLRSPLIGVDGELLISQAVYSVGPEGTTTELTLRRPDAFKPEPQLRPTGLWKEIARGV